VGFSPRDRGRDRWPERCGSALGAPPGTLARSGHASGKPRRRWSAGPFDCRGQRVTTVCSSATAKRDVVWVCMLLNVPLVPSEPVQVTFQVIVYVDVT